MSAAENARIPPRSQGETEVRASRSFALRNLLRPMQVYLHTAEVGGLVLVAAAALALAWANSPWGDLYTRLWENRLTLEVGALRITEDLRHWVNDGLMTLFFFSIGLEVKRALTYGELSSPGRAALPVAAAIGGMVVPAALFLAFTIATPAVRGWGIPVATDIAFALGILALAGGRVPMQARILLLGLAAADDVGGILVIAAFYTKDLSVPALLAAAGLVGVIVVMRALGLRAVLFYVVAGVGLWLAVFFSGVHATVAGVVLGLMAPARRDFDLRHFDESVTSLLDRYRRALKSDDERRASSVLGQVEELTRGTEPPVERLERLVHPWVSFAVLPVFAFANSGIDLSPDSITRAATDPAALGVFVGLLLGKPVGVIAFSWVAVRAGVAELPGSVSWRHVAGIGLLAGIGFTVSIFIAELAFAGAAEGELARLGILGASVLSAALGYAWLAIGASDEPPEGDEEGDEVDRASED